MRRASSHTTTYKDLVDLSTEVVRERQAWYDGARAKGTSNLDALVKKLETAKALERLLKKGQPEKQTDLFTLFEMIRK